MKNTTVMRYLGLACLAGGILFFFSLIMMFSLKGFPYPVRLFFEEQGYILKTTFFLSQIGFMCGLYGLLLTRAMGISHLRNLLLIIPLLGQICYAASAWMSTKMVLTLLPIPLTQLGALLNAIGMVLIGMAVLRAKVWVDPYR